ncbi:MAG TPA: zf-HC2 domain-containing protein [Burkholderiales bacterium]|nr:zf-HC2 domain-containing protein [Burkholderiales bacterium]
MKPLLSCREVSQLVSQGLDRRLGWLERTRLRLHLLICDGCTNFSKQMQFLRKALARLAEQSKP